MQFITRFSGFIMILCIATNLQAKKTKPLIYGPTGIEGSESKRTIKVANTQKGSPASGKLKKGDVIIGLNGKKFGKSPKHEIAAAIDVAETKKAGGKLTLTIKGNKAVVLTLPVLGSYSSTAPYKCKKTDKIITQLAESLLKSTRAGSGVLSPGILGLMATGEKKYMDAATGLIKKSKLLQIDPKKVDALLRGDIDMGYVGWYWGYALITLGEYYLLTDDKSVLPAMKTYAMGLARGQDGGGLWGHRMATDKRGGRLPGYAQMNQSSLSCFMGMLFAKKCGIKDPVLDAAIAKTYDYFAYFVGRGTFPYGVHGPKARDFNNNGMSGSAAICMSLLDNQNGALFFSKLSAVGFDTLEQGHASNYFNPFWTSLGANFAGPEVTKQFFRKSLWFHNLKRKWDGSYGNDKMKEGPEAGVALLNYCLQRNALLITGRKADKSIWLKPEKATETVMMKSIDYSSKSNDELIVLAKEHSIPQIRRRANWELLKNRQSDLTPKWVSYLSKGAKEDKKLALSMFGMHTALNIKKDKLSKIGIILRNSKETLNTRLAAAQSICHFGELAYPYYMDIVKLIAEEPANGRISSYIEQDLGSCVATLCKEPFGKGLVTNKDMFYKAALKLIDHKRSLGRTSGLLMLVDMPFEDLHRVIDKVMYVTKNEDATYESYHSIGGTLGTSLSILAKHNIKEGLSYFVKLWKAPGKNGFKVRMVCATLHKYGGNARDVLGELEKLNPGHNSGRFKGMWQKMAKAIRDDKNPPKLITLEEALKNRK
jgi:hypothetical protein